MVHCADKCATLYAIIVYNYESLLNVWMKDHMLKWQFITKVYFFSSLICHLQVNLNTHGRFIADPCAHLQSLLSHPFVFSIVSIISDHNVHSGNQSLTIIFLLLQSSNNQTSYAHHTVSWTSCVPACCHGSTWCSSDSVASTTAAPIDARYGPGTGE